MLAKRVSPSSQINIPGLNNPNLMQAKNADSAVLTRIPIWPATIARSAGPSGTKTYAPGSGGSLMLTPIIPRNPGGRLGWLASMDCLKFILFTNRELLHVLNQSGEWCNNCCVQVGNGSGGWMCHNSI